MFVVTEKEVLIQLAAASAFDSAVSLALYKH